MIFRFFLLWALCAACGSPMAYALDWKRLHEEADSLGLEEALQRLPEDPASPEGLYLLGLVCLNLHKDADAQDAFLRLLALAPQTAEAQWGLAEVARRQHRLQECQRLLEKVFEAYPEFPPALITLSYAEYSRMDFKKSVELAYRVLRQGEQRVDTSNLARAYLLVAGGKGMLAHYGGPIAKIANGTAVLPNLKKAASLRPDAAAVLFGLGSFYFLAPPLVGQDRAKALECLERAVEKDPLFADAYVRLAQIYRMNGENEKYARCIAKARQIDPQNILLLDMESGECRFICFSPGK